MLDFPHKKGRGGLFNRTVPENPTDKFNNTVKELRVMLNKLSRDNFDSISRKIIEKFKFTPSLLHELAVSPASYCRK